MKKYPEIKAKYEQKRLNKSVSFNLKEDAEIIKLANKMDFSNEVKDWLRTKKAVGKSEDKS